MTNFPNGVVSYLETLAEIAMRIGYSQGRADFDSHHLTDLFYARLEHIREMEGTMGLNEMAIILANRFELLYKGHTWGVDSDLEWTEAIDSFLDLWATSTDDE